MPVNITVTDFRLHADSLRKLALQMEDRVGAHEMSQCPDGTGSLLWVLCELGAQLAEQNAILERIASAVEGIERR